jgi:hypothetical protein
MFRLTARKDVVRDVTMSLHVAFSDQCLTLPRLFDGRLLMERLLFYAGNQDR